MTTESCFPELTSLDVIETFNPGTAYSFSHRLKSANTGGEVLTNATLEGQFDGQKLNLGFRFEVDGVSLPYNIYAVLVASASRVLGWFDLTNGCTGPQGYRIWKFSSPIRCLASLGAYCSGQHNRIGPGTDRNRRANVCWLPSAQIVREMPPRKHNFHMR